MYNRNKLNFFKELVHCNYSMNFSQYDTDMNVIETDFDYELSLNQVRLADIAIQQHYMDPHLENGAMPRLISDELGVMWAVIFELEKGEVIHYHIMGPAFVNQKSLTHIDHLLNGISLNIPAKRQIRKYLERLPLLSSTNFYQYAVMFHYCIRREKIQISDLQHTSISNIKDQLLAKELYPQELTNKSMVDDSDDYGREHHPSVRHYEELITKAISTGDISKLHLLEKGVSISSGMQTKHMDFIQSAKFSSITLLTLCSRAAIEGGLPSATAYSLSDIYGDEVNACRTLEDIRLLNGAIFKDFVTRVHNYRQNSKISQPIQTCCDYILMNVPPSNLSMDELAHMAGYSNYYFSRKFKKEVGVTVNQYILNVKIDYAKNLLRTGNLTITKIGEMLNFCSRSYFTDVFLRNVGVTPLEYRKQKDL